MRKRKQHNLEMLPIAFVAEYDYCQRSAFYYITGAENGEEENPFIQSGRAVHFKIDIKGTRYRSIFKELKRVKLVNYKYGLVGNADLVREYKKELVPVEYKSGNFRYSRFHKFQLLLQALCLQEQFNKQVFQGCVYFYQVNKLYEYNLNKEDYFQAVNILNEIRQKLSESDISLFTQINKPNCIHCSFYDICLPFLK